MVSIIVHTTCTYATFLSRKSRKRSATLKWDEMKLPQTSTLKWSPDITGTGTTWGPSWRRLPRSTFIPKRPQFTRRKACTRTKVLSTILVGMSFLDENPNTFDTICLCSTVEGAASRFSCITWPPQSTQLSQSWSFVEKAPKVHLRSTLHPLRT